MRDEAPQDEDRILAIKRAAEARLLLIPGVHAVSVGAKMVDGRPTGEIAIRVLVRRKRPLHDLSLAEVIPPQIEGVKTDVIEAQPPRPFAADEDKYRPLKGGVQVQVEPGLGSGTLGCLARTTGPNPQVVALSNHHVLLGPGATAGNRVGQPVACSICSACCTDVIGQVLRGILSPKVDGAIATLDAGLAWVAEVHEIGAVAGTHTVTAAEAATGTYIVHKRGRTTGLTSGVLVGIAATGTAVDHDGNPVRSYTDQIEIDDPPGGPAFSDSGDSGSAILNGSREAVALLWGGTANHTTASPIADVESELGIRIATNPPRTVHIVPGTADPPPGPPSLPPDFPLSPPAEPYAGLYYRYVELLQSPEGRLGVDLYQRHQREVRALVNTNRRVAAIWHRSGGPAVLRALLHGAESPDELLPAVVDGRPVAEGVARILGVLTKYGSPELQADIARYGPAVLDLGGLSYAQALVRLRAAGR